LKNEPKPRATPPLDNGLGVTIKPMLPKYSLSEIERRWQVERSAVDSLEDVPYRTITDLYIQGTQMRLRKEEGGSETVYKLCKKYGKVSALSEPITNLYLNEAEYGLLEGLPGNWISKRRYKLEGGSLDVYENPQITFFEKEFATEEEALAYQTPAFVGQEVTGQAAVSGAALASSGDLR
jgi:CYTH domain-containing protein